MCKEHITAIKEVLKHNGRHGLPILQCLCHTDGKLWATDLTTMVAIKTPTIADGIWDKTALDFGFREETKNKEFEPADFPELQGLELDTETELTSDEMAKILYTSKFVSKDQTRPVLTGVAIQDSKAYASDGYFMHRDVLSLPGDITIILPSEAVKVLKAVKADKKNWTLTVYKNSDLAFTSGNFTLYTKQIDGRTPDYDNLLTSMKTYDERFTLDLKTLVVPKGYMIRFDRDERTLSLYDVDTKKAIPIQTDIPVDNTTHILNDWNTRTIIMAMSGTSSHEILFNPDLLKPFGKSKIELSANAERYFMDVRCIK